MDLPSLRVQRISIPNPNTEGRTCDDGLNDYLALPQQFNVINVQHLCANYNDSADVIAGNVASETYLLTRAVAV